MLTYADGRELCSSYVAERPERFERLLTEQVRVGEIRGGDNNETTDRSRKTSSIAGAGFEPATSGL